MFPGLFLAKLFLFFKESFDSTMAAAQFQDLAAHYDELMDVVPYDFWAEYVMTLFEFVGHVPTELLDCACGTGNLSFELAKLGLHVTGVDLSSPMILQARQKAAQSNLPYEIQFYEGDLSNFELGTTFDSATCLYDSLNYILDNKTLTSAFAQIRKHVKPGGIFVFDFNSQWAFEANLFTQSSHKPTKSLQYEWFAKFDEKTRICTVQMKFLRKDKEGNMIEFHETHKERAYAIPEIEEMLKKTDWKLLHTFDAYTLHRPHARSERWFFVAQAN
jgi:ubiquinone/menaquinone biosynthesis C-methylase UbiE